MSQPKNTEIGRFAKPDEVVGFWEMVPFAHPEAINSTNPWSLPHQSFAFYADGIAASVHSTAYRPRSAQSLKAVLDPIKDRSPRYAWKNGFLVITSREEGVADEIWAVNIFLQQSVVRDDTFFPGDLLMSLEDGVSSKPVYYRHLRRLP